MKNYLLLTIFITSFVMAQPKKTSYEVDGVFVETVFYEEFQDLNDSIVHAVNIIEDPLILNRMGYENTEKLTQIYTKAFINRPDSLKRIPTTKQMLREDGKWYLSENSKPYTGKFRDYYLTGKLQGKGQFVEGKLQGERWMYFKNGKVAEYMQYENGFPEGKEIRYYEDGTIKQIGFYKEGFEIGEWKKFHPNGKVKQISNFNEEGQLNGEIKTFYSTGQLKGSSVFKNGNLVEDKKTKKITSTYENAERKFQLGNFKEAIQLFSTCIKLKPDWNDAYFARGTAHLNNFNFEEALADFNKAIELEPLDAYSYSNRAFVRIRKAEFKEAKQISSDKAVQVFATKKAKISSDDIKLICSDLEQAKQLGDNSRLLVEAKLNYCIKE